MKKRIFMTGQQTQKALEIASAHLADTVEIRASCPPFNVRCWNDAVPVQCFNAAAFGTEIPKAIITLTRHPLIANAMCALSIAPLKMSLNTFAVDQVKRVRAITKYLRCRSTQNYGAVVDKMESFVERFSKCKSSDFDNEQAWLEFRQQECGLPADCDRRLHFDHVLQMFGCSDELSKEIRQAQRNQEEGAMKLEHYALRPLVRALSGYNLQGCIADIVNYCYVALSKSTANQSEQDVLATLHAFGDAFADDSARKRLWVPDIYIQDAEHDDMITWAILKVLNPALEVIVQLPCGDVFNALEHQFTSMDNVRVFRDRDSTNGGPIQRFFKLGAFFDGPQ